MIREELRQLKTGRRELRKFGWMVGLVLALLGAWFSYRGRAAGPYLWGPGLVLVLGGWLAPAMLRQVYLAWMTLALVLGLIVSTLLLTLFFYLVITPIGLLARVVGQDFLGLKLDPNAPTYWIRREPAKTPEARDYERQF